MRPRTHLNTIATQPIAASELVLTNQGRLYHLNLVADDIGDTVITVGDPERVAMISQHFDRFTFKTQQREFTTHCGEIGQHRITVLSTGMGTENIDIVLNELDAAINIDLKTRQLRAKPRRLNIIRIGTTGAMHADLALDSTIISGYAIGLDGLLHYYNFENDEQEALLTQQVANTFPVFPITPYISRGSQTLIERFSGLGEVGITITACGFYGPQDRQLRLPTRIDNLLDQLKDIKHDNHRVTNFEMETAGMYGLGSLLNHEVCSVSCVIANRQLKTFSSAAHRAVNRLIRDVLDRLTD